MPAQAGKSHDVRGRPRLKAEACFPAISGLSECIIELLNNHQNHLETIVKENLPPEIQSLLDDLLIQESSSKTKSHLCQSAFFNIPKVFKVINCTS